MNNQNEIALDVTHIQFMAEAIEHLTFEAGPELSQVKGVAVGIATLADKVTTMIEDMEAKERDTIRKKVA